MLKTRLWENQIEQTDEIRVYQIRCYICTAVKNFKRNSIEVDVENTKIKRSIYSK